MTDFDPITSLLGGVLIGLAVATLFLFNGRILGVSNITAEALSLRSSDRGWRLLFLAGLGLGGVLIHLSNPTLIGDSPRALPGLIIAGLLVGYGSALGRGCTSGHGICGISRLSLRSIVATAVFMSTGMLTVFVVNHMIGG
ncbi:MAG: YeeE/YedE family protein [Gammaproteobacteria bacterium]|nr:YeeE/YedE family protein [Gammaproteobacteria bacterium]